MTQVTMSLDECRTEALRLLLDYKEASIDTRTPLLRQLARVIVTAREHFLTDEGEPDWKGLTYAYRQWLADLYDAAHFDREERTTVQASVRYHVGTVLREVLDEATLTELGMMKKTPKERSAERRTNRMALLNALTHSQMPRGEMLALSAAYSMLTNVKGDELDALPKADRDLVSATLADIERRVKALRRRVALVE